MERPTPSPGCAAFDPPRNAEINTWFDPSSGELQASYLDPETAVDVTVSFHALDMSCLKNVELARTAEHALVTSSRYKRCRGRETLITNVDGDDLPDLLFHDWLDRSEGGRARLGVCTGAGAHDRIDGGGMSETLFVHDVDEDGSDEIFFGGTTVSAEYVAVARFIDGRLIEVRPRGGGALTLVRGLDFVRLSLIPAGASFGCDDVDDDGTRDLVSATVVSATGGRLRWHLVGYALDGRYVEQIWDDGGTFRAGRGKSALVGQAAILTPGC
ncbi:MAG: hypothetical protein M3277_01005 [Actinomycetota bacterium]|nr:hypothetical protein [Actinomycetota bacterium]